MKKQLFVSIIAATMLLSACGGNNQNSPSTKEYTISYYGEALNAPLLGVDLSSSTLPKKAEAGDTVNVNIVLLDGYAFDSFLFSSASVNNQILDHTVTSFSFVMPKENISAYLSTHEEGASTFESLRNGVTKQHNYTIDINSYYVNYPSESYTGTMYMLNNETYFGNDPEYYNIMYKGYTKVKDQGIAEFNLGLSSTDIVLGDFVATNPELTIYDIHGGLIEYVLESELTLVEENHYRVSKQDLVGIVGTFSGLELAYISNPEYIDIYKQGNTIVITDYLTANYYDEETLDPKENEPVYVGLTIKNIGTTSNALLDNFSKDESNKVANPTKWDDDIRQSFTDHFNCYIPPFINGLSYSFHHSTDWNGYNQKYEIKGQDFACGDLRSAYGQLLEGEGFTLTSANKYEKRVKNAEETNEQVYCVEMNYISPSTSYGDKTYGYYYTNGVFQIMYYTYSNILSSVTTVNELNTYLDSTGAKNILPRFDSNYGTSAVSGFSDRTEAVNQLYGGGFIFSTSQTAYFTISISGYSDALTFVSSLVTASSNKGFTSVSHNPMTKMINISDSADSYIEISDVEAIGSSAYNGKLQCRIVVRDNYTSTYDITINSDAGVASKSITSPANYMAVEAGTKVTFTFTLVEGYELDEITSNVSSVTFNKESGENVYSFSMPSSNITISITTKSKAAEEGLEYDRDYVVYVDNSNNKYDSAPAVVHSLLKLRFSEDGTGTYSRQTFNSSGTSTGGPWTMNFNYSLVNGAFSLTLVSGNVTEFSKWRLFTSNISTELPAPGNNTGTFANSQITITVVDASLNETVLTFK